MKNKHTKPDFWAVTRRDWMNVKNAVLLTVAEFREDRLNTALLVFAIVVLDLMIVLPLLMPGDALEKLLADLRAM